MMLTDIWERKPGPRGLPADLELERFVDVTRSGTGEPADLSLWRVAYYTGDPAGVVLVNDTGSGTGTLGYIGLVPELRGRGLGRALHAEALWLMRSSGLERYEDATGYDNVPMRAIFAGAGCEPIGSAVMYARDPRLGESGGGRRTVPSKAGVGRIPLGRHVSLLRKVPCRAG
jgi:GNAT superfamily N-acetyltransferase